MTYLGDFPGPEVLGTRDHVDREREPMIMDWNHVIQCIRHELSPIISTAVETAVTWLKVRGHVKMNDLSDNMVNRVLLQIQKITLSNREAAYIKYATKRARNYKHERAKGM